VTAGTPNGGGSGGTELLRTVIGIEADVFAVRRQGRQLAAALGLESQDQIRVAAALSEVGRRLLGSGPVTVVFVMAEDHSMLTFSASVAGIVDDVFIEAVQVTKGLMDHWEIERTAHTTVTMGRRLPWRAVRLSADEIQAIRNDIGQLSAGTPFEELAEHNRQLLATLQEVQSQRDELLRLNGELEETNKGVVALYTELSEELQATNRGVVALYAELDQRATQVRAASDAKTRFLANVSHELRAPVTSIVGLVRLLRDPSSDPLSDEQGQQLGLITASAGTLLTLVNELLDLAKAESGRLEPTFEPTDLKNVLDTLRGTMRAVNTNEGTILTVDDPVGVPPVRTDSILLTQVLSNLLTNALKFTPSGEVRLSTYLEADGRLALAVADTGIGIPAEELDRIFEEFHQVRHPLQASVTGTGLGLPYAQRLVELLGGSITVASTPGEGSTFTVHLPTDGPAGAVTAGDAGAQSVLVVDDDEAFRTAVAGVLRGKGILVTEAPDGRTALMAMEAHAPDLVLLDLRLPHLDGFGVLDAIAQDERLQALTVVVLSAYPDHLAGAAADRHVAAVLDKTRIELDDLPDLLRRAMPRWAA
jgi:signal transduction histidine kinase